MSYYVILAAVGIAIFLSIVFSSSFTRRNAGGGIVPFFLLVFMAAWASQLWVRPMGPITQGIAWVPLVFVSSLVAFLLAFSVSAAGTTDTTTNSAPAPRQGNFLSAIGFIFWIIIVIFLAAIVLGYYFAPRAAEMAFHHPVITNLV